MPKKLSELTKEATDELYRRLDQHLMVKNLTVGSKTALAHDLLPLLTTAIAEAWSEAQKWDAEAVHPKSEIFEEEYSLTREGLQKLIEVHQKVGWNDAREALLKAQAESVK